MFILYLQLDWRGEYEPLFFRQMAENRPAHRVSGLSLTSAGSQVRFRTLARCPLTRLYFPGLSGAGG